MSEPRTTDNEPPNPFVGKSHRRAYFLGYDAGRLAAERASGGLDVERLALVFRENGYWDAYAVMVDHGKVVESEYARLTGGQDDE